MLRRCSRTDFDAYADFAYALARDLTSSGYPTYCDGIKTKAMFLERLGKAFERNNEALLLFEYEGAVQGLIQYYWLPEDRYLAANAFNIRRGTEQALAEFLALAGEQFKGYELYLGFPAENTRAIRFLSEHGFACIEDNYNNTAFLDRLGLLPEGIGLIRIGRENYDLFRVLHDPIDGDMYWNSERILADLDRWIVLVREQNGRPRGAVYYTDAGEGWFEIFGIDMAQGVLDRDVFRELLTGALYDAWSRGGRVMTFFDERESEEITKECGFVCIGNHLCYKIPLV